MYASPANRPLFQTEEYETANWAVSSSVESEN